MAEHLARQNNDDASDSGDTPYHDLVCKPQVADDEAMPPCVSIEVIEIACLPNGTDAIHYEAHAQCMCNGSFFAEKLGCERCLYVHGLRSEREFARYEDVVAAAEEALCSGSAAPSADFAEVFASADAIVSGPATGATATGTEAASSGVVSRTDVSLYYTASGGREQQGPGTITGEAASATATATTTATETETETETGGTTDAGSGSDDADEAGDSRGSDGDDEADGSSSGDDEESPALSMRIAGGFALVAAAGGALLIAM